MRLITVLICLALVGCHPDPASRRDPVEDAVTVFRSSNRVRATGFYLRYKNRTFFVTAKHAVENRSFGKTWNKFRDDVDVTLAEDQGVSYLLPSEKFIPFGTLEYESGRPEFPVVVQGYNGHMEKVVSKGLACGRLPHHGGDTIFITAPIVLGMSGSPVLDEEGRVLAVVGSVLTLKEGEGRGDAKTACTPIQRVLLLMESL